LPGLDPSVLEPLGALAARAGLPAPEVVNGPRFAFRHRARLAVRGRAQNPKIGIFESSSHRVVHIPDCKIHHPLVNEVARLVRRTMVEHRVSPYSDAAHAGSVRYLQIVVERQSETAQVVIVTREANPDGFASFFAALRERLGARLHSLWWNGQPERSNAVLGELWSHISGPETVSETNAGVRLFYPPGAFGQSHLALADRIASAVSELVPNGAHLVEYYAGVGALSLPLAARLTRLQLNELSEGSLAGLERGLAELPSEVRARTSVHAGSAGEHAERLRGADVVLVDPPRKGLDRALLDQLVNTPVPRLVYVSCGLPALLGEAERLFAGGYRLSALKAFALFPYTEHVETLAVFEATNAER
jgi:tRNA/tmRNA/rRNA uracil-C5-methylase (TrmA/RlmC/RlmD family)